MLTQMSIRNFALIEQMNISFNDGITIFTGETGAFMVNIAINDC